MTTSGLPTLTDADAAKLLHLKFLDTEAAALEAEKVFREACGGDTRLIRPYFVELIKAGVRYSQAYMLAFTAIEDRERRRIRP